MRITDASSISDHIDKAIREDCYLAKDIPLPAEINAPIARMLKYEGIPSQNTGNTNLGAFAP